MLETDHRKLLFIRGGTSAKVSHLAESLASTCCVEWEVPNINDFDPSLSASSYRFGLMRVVEKVSKGARYLIDVKILRKDIMTYSVP